MTYMKQTLRRIEDRKIEILMEIGEINRQYGERISVLREEYEKLDLEYYTLRFERMTRHHRIASPQGDGEP